MKRLDTDEEKEEMVRFLLKRFNDRERIKPNSYLCLSCKHYKPRKRECKRIKGFLGEDFTHGDGTVQFARNMNLGRIGNG